MDRHTVQTTNIELGSIHLDTSIDSHIYEPKNVQHLDTRYVDR